MQDISGRTALVTGGGDGMGRAISLKLAGLGARVAVADIRPDAAAEVADLASSAGGEAVPFMVDIADATSVEKLAADVQSHLGPPSIVFAHAGVGVPGGIASVSANNRRWALAVNIDGMLNTISAFVPMLSEGTGPRNLVVTASVAGLVKSDPNNSFYSMTKHAVIGMAEGLRADLADSGITVSCLCPGLVNTRIWESVKTRQAEFGGARDIPPEVGRHWEEDGISADLVADQAVAGMLNGEFYIVVPSDRGLERFSERFDEITDAVKKGLERSA